MIAVFLTILAAFPAVTCQDQPPQAREAAHPAGLVAVDGLLDAIERADADLQNLQAQIVYDRRGFLSGDRQVHYGDLVFANIRPEAGEGVRRVFGLRLDHYFVDGARREDGTEYAFDGEWLVERRPEQKIFIKRRIAAPGETADPFRLGDGPLIPLPLGQRKADVLERYEASVLPPEPGLEDPADANYRGFAHSTHQLLLTPKPGTDDEFKEIRLWYREGTLVPVMSRVVHRNQDVSVVQLVNVRSNQEDFPSQRTSTKETHPPDGWQIQVDPGRMPVEEPAAEGGDE